MPAIRALSASGLKVGVFSEESQAPFWEMLSGITVVPFPKNSKIKVLAAALSGKWAASIAWEKGEASEIFAKAAIPRRLGPQEKFLAKQLTHPLTINVTPLEHRVRFYLSAAKAMGVPVENPDFFLPMQPLVEKTPNSVLICPDSDYGANHEWPLERWETIARTFQEQEIPLVIGTLSHGRNLGKSLAARLHEDMPVVAFGCFGTELNLLATYSSVICADGSLPHLASSMGATCAVFFGPNDPAWKRPLGKRHLIVRRHVECAPCLMDKCKMDLRCQNDLTVERVKALIFA